jgi:hypothetical protein
MIERPQAAQATRVRFPPVGRFRHMCGQLVTAGYGLSALFSRMFPVLRIESGPGHE